MLRPRLAGRAPPEDFTGVREDFFLEADFERVIGMAKLL
jgi:hypothetical protein